MQFKCSSCGCKFDAQEGGYVICPNCKSDNVAPFKPSPMRIIIPFLGVLVIAIGTFFVIQYVKNGKNEAPAKEVAQRETATTVTEKSTDAPVEVKAEPVKVEPVIMEFSDPKLKKGKYSFLINSQNIPNGVKVKYLLMDSKGNNTIMESETGSFKDVPASKEVGGMYSVAMVNAADGSVLASPKVIHGFVKEEVKVAKMAKEELEGKINARSNDLLTAHPQISKKVVLAFDNLKEGEKKPVTFDAIFEKIIMTDWESVQVTSVSYEKSGKINKISMHIKHLEF